jgi:DNA-binding NtrC family response regulator
MQLIHHAPERDGVIGTMGLCCNQQQISHQGTKMILKILLVEADPEDGAIFSSELGERMEVKLVRHHQEARRIMETEAVDGVVLDLEGLSGRGLALLQALQRMTPRVPVVVLSSTSGPVRAAKLIRLGATNYVAKPVETATLRKVVEEEVTVMGPGRDAEKARAVI